MPFGHTGYSHAYILTRKSYVASYFSAELAGSPNGQPAKKRKKQNDADLPQLDGATLDGAQAVASLPRHGSLLAQKGALHLLESLLQVTQLCLIAHPCHNVSCATMTAELLLYWHRVLHVLHLFLLADASCDVSCATVPAVLLL